MDRMVSNLLKLKDLDIIIVRLLRNERAIHIEEDSDLLSYLDLPLENTEYDADIGKSIKFYYPPVNEDSPIYNPTLYLTYQEYLDMQPKEPPEEIESVSEDEDTLS